VGSGEERECAAVGDGRPATVPERAFLLALLAVSRRLRARGAGQLLEPGAFLMLHAVASHGPARPSELADQLRLDASTVSRHLRNLEQAGLVVRGADPNDRRAARVCVSAAGETALDEAFQARQALLSRAFASWAVADREALVSLLTRLAADLSRLDEEKTYEPAHGRSGSPAER
jgi:DNA-binding MarR family transcriptional regulator